MLLHKVSDTKHMEENIQNKHDKGYKYLLGTKRLFVQLLRCFVQQGWAQKIAPEDVELVDKSYILQDFKDKETDLVYKVKMDGNEVYFYLLELQSTVDFQMPYRLLLYMVEIWRGILKDTDSKEVKRKDFRLPVIVPCVLYNGENNWTVVYTEEAKKDLKNLDHSQRLQVIKAINKVSINPLPAFERGYGKPLGNHASSKLAGYLKIKLQKLGLRVIYSLVRDKNLIRIIIISVRDDESVYRQAQERITYRCQTPNAC